MGYIWQSYVNYYFGLDYIKRFASDLLEIEAENNFKRDNQMIFTEKDKLYHNATKTFYICGKTSFNNVKDHCHEMVKYRGPTCKMCNLMFK